MKKLTMICMSALLLLAVSCKKDKETKVENAGQGFTATSEQQSGDSKTHLDGEAVKWNSGDAILVKSSTCTTPKRFSTTGNDISADFEAAESLPGDFYKPNYTAYYPADKFSGGQLTLPATQQYDENNTFSNGANPMAATSTTNVLSFKNICGVLELQLYSASACQVQSISITTSDDTKPLCGTGTVTITGGIPSLGTLSDGGSTLTLVMGEGGKAMSTNADSPSCYYFVVPAGTLGTSFTVKVTDTNGEVWTKTANNTHNLIERSKITKIQKTSVATHEPVTPDVTTTVGCVGCTYTFSGNVTVSGTHDCEYGFVYAKTADNADPTIGGTDCMKFPVNTEPVSGSKDFTADLSLMGLEEYVEYTVKAYGICDKEAYGDKQTYIYSKPKPLPDEWTNGKNPHPFTVASGDKVVYFSQGNLQYIGSAATPYWKFAEHQFDFLGDSGQGSDSQTADRDLFGWGTSGWGNGNHFYQPYDTDNSTYGESVGYGYGPTNGSSYTFNLTGDYAYADWGVYNTISNGGSSSWRTLTKDEWVYLIDTRTDNGGNKLYGEGRVGRCTPGLIILPDDWSWSGDLASFESNWTPGTSAWSNVYSYSDWAKMEAAGAVFLPAAGYRQGTSVKDVGSIGEYWSSSYNNNDPQKNYVYGLNFYSEGVYPRDHENTRCDGRSVRLVSDIE